MALDDLSGTLETPARDAIATNFRRDYGLVSPESDTSDGTQPDVLAKTVATTLLPVYSNAVMIAGAINEDEASWIDDMSLVMDNALAEDVATLAGEKTL